MTSFRPSLSLAVSVGCFWAGSSCPLSHGPSGSATCRTRFFTVRPNIYIDKLLHHWLKDPERCQSASMKNKYSVFDSCAQFDAANQGFLACFVRSFVCFVFFFCFFLCSSFSRNGRVTHCVLKPALKPALNPVSAMIHRHGTQIWYCS